MVDFDFQFNINPEDIDSVELGGLVDHLETTFAEDRQYTDILDWYDNGGVDKEKLGIELTPQQRLILAVFYGIELTEEQHSILEFWKAKDRTTYDFDFGPRERGNLVLESGRRAGKCERFDSLIISQSRGIIYLYELLNDAMGISKESYVNTEKGLVNLVRDNNLIGESLPLVETVAIEGASKTALTNALYIKGVEQTKKITTQCGYNLEATPEHRIKVVDKTGRIVWKYFSDIQVGDYVCIHRATNLFPTEYIKLSDYAPDPTEHGSGCKPIDTADLVLDKHFGYLLGLLASNGSWTVPGGLQLTFHQQDTYIYEQAISLATRRLNLENAKPSKVKNDQRSQFGCHLMVWSKLLRKLFHNLGFTIDSIVNNKKTPWSIRQSPKDVQAAYLSGLFDGDGSVEKGGKAITLSTASKTLANETQLLLLNFGIVSRVKEKYVKGKPYYILTLRGRRSNIKFINEIGFKLERKQQPVINNLNSTVKEGGDTERIPYQIEWLKRVRDTLPNNMGEQPGSRRALTSYNGEQLQTLRNYRMEYREIVGNCIKASSGELLSSYRLKKVLEFAEQFSDDREAISHFNHLNDCDYFYDPIVSVEDSETLCLDLSVPDHHQYVSQGFTNHNSMLGSLILCYEFEKLCRIPSPQAFFGIASSTLISMICIATSAEQAKQTIYGQTRAMFRNVYFLDKLVKAGKIDLQEKAIKYEEKLLYIYSGNSKSETQVGGSPIVIVLDEGALFEDKDGQSNALTLWDNLGAGGLVFGKYAKRCIISSAWREGDALVELYKAAKESQAWIGFRLRSWDVNPKFASRDNPVIDGMYVSNRAMAELLYEGIRSSAHNAYFDPDSVKASFDNMSDLYAMELPDDGDKLVKLKIHRVGKFNGRTYMHLDPAVIHDAYALAYGHSYISEGKLHVSIDGIMSWTPRDGRNVSIMNVQEAIYHIHLHRPLFKVTADNKESSETLQRLNTSGISTEIVGFSNPRQLGYYDVMRRLALEGRLHLPKNSPWTELLKEELLYLTVRQTKSAGQVRVDHLPDKSKDIADCCAVVCYYLAADTFSFKVQPRPQQNSNYLLPDQQVGFGRAGLMADVRSRKKSWGGVGALNLN
jgi:intein/homing endonuclease